MTFHDPRASMQDLAFPPTVHDRLRAVQAAGRDRTGGAVPIQAQAEINATAGRETDTEAIRFFVPGKPQGKGRPRAAKRGKHVVLYTPEKTVSYESTVALAASQAMAGRAPIEGPVSVVVRMRHPVPQSWSKRKQAQALDSMVLPTVKCDADNCVKAVFDAINGIVWVDDVQVVELALTKRYAAVPGVSVVVSRVEAAE